MIREGIIARLTMLDTVEVVGEVGDAQELCPTARRAQPDMVLMDVQIGRADGVELVRQLKGEHPSLLFLMLSMFHDPVIVSRSMQAGAHGYVVKDAPISDLLCGIEQVAAGGTFFSDQVRGRALRSQLARPKLSFRESQILSQVAQGRSCRETSQALGLSARTVETHRRNIMRKLNLCQRGSLTEYATEICQDASAPRSLDE